MKSLILLTLLVSAGFGMKHLSNQSVYVSSTPEVAVATQETEYDGPSIDETTHKLCIDTIKKNLKDPDSFRRIGTVDEEMFTGEVKYTATNSFGARVQHTHTCHSTYQVKKFLESIGH